MPFSIALPAASRAFSAAATAFSSAVAALTSAVASVVVCAPGAGHDALAVVEPGGSILVFAEAGELDSAEVYRREITVTGSRSATRRHMEEAVALLSELDLPEALVLPLERFDEGLAAYRSRVATKVVFRP